MEEHQSNQTSPKAGEQPEANAIAKRNSISDVHRSPLRFLIIIIAAIFVAEIVAMIVVAALPTASYFQITLVDAGIMVVLIFPVLYFFSFRPLLRQNEKSHRAEERLRHVNRALSVLNECNQVLVRCENEKELLGQMCEIIVKTGEYRMAWVGFAEQDEARNVRPAAHFGFEDGYLESAKISWGDNEWGRGPTGTAIREGAVQVNQNFLTNPHMTPWRESALLRGFQSSIALPLQGENSAFGALTIYSALPESFNGEEVHLLLELANDLAFGIMALRVRLERDRAQAQIREMALFPVLNPNAVVRVNPSEQVTMANPAAEGIGLCVGAQLTDVIPTLEDVDLASVIASGATQQIPETYLGEHVLQWTIHGAPELGLAFLYSSDVTLRKQAEDLNRRLSRIVEQTEDTVVVTNCEGIIEYVNPAFERLTGYAKEEVLGKTPRVLKSGVHDNDFYGELWNTILSGNVFLAEVANRKKNGELFYEVKTITPLRDGQGTITHFVATGKDITEHKRDEEALLRAYDDLEMRVLSRTEELRVANSELQAEIAERKQAEEALQQSEEMLSWSQEIAHLGSWELDLVNDRLTWSDEVYRIFGLQSGTLEATYEAFLSVVHPDDRQAVDDAYSSSVRDGKDGYEIEHRIIRQATGEIRILHEKCEHFKNEAGEIIRSAGMVHDITERKRAEEQLEGSNQKLNEILTSIQDDFYVLNRDWNFVYASRLFTSKVGKEPEEFVGNNIWKMFPKHVGSVLEENFRAAMEKREVRRFEIGGKYTSAWYRMTVFPSAEGITVLGMDITERKRAEEQLRYQAALLSNVNDAIIASDAQFCITAWNAAAESLYGWKAEESIGGNGVELLRTEWPEKDAHEMRRMIAETGHWRGEATQARKDGSRFPVEVSSIVLHDDRGQITGYISVNRDITERKRTEEFLQKIYAGLEQRVQERTEELAAANRELVKEIAERREIERQLRIQAAAMEAAANGIIITDCYGNIEWANPALAQISGYEARDLMGQNMHIFRSGQHDQAFYQQMWNTILSGQVWRGEITNRGKDGRLYVEDQTITPVLGDQGEITQFIAIKQDITERKQAEKELKARNQKEKVLTQTIHTMQLEIARDLHDTIGQNISFLRMKLDYLAGKKTIKRAEMKTELENMAKAANDSYDLIRGTLAILQSADSNDLYRLFTRYAEQIEDRSTFKMISSSQGEARFLSAKRMRQLFYIFREILGNIEKHAHASQVTMEMCWNADHLQLNVFDNGKGFEMDQVPLGSHYGLRFMKERAELLNGSLLIQSAVGSGTSVILQVPYE